MMCTYGGGQCRSLQRDRVSLQNEEVLFGIMARSASVPLNNPLQMSVGVAAMTSVFK